MATSAVQLKIVPPLTAAAWPITPSEPLLAKWAWLDWLCRLGFRAGILRRWLGTQNAWVACKRRPLAELPVSKQQQIRQAYKDTDWSSDYSIEFIGIFTDEVDAIEAASIPGGFVHELPVGHGLPDIPIQYGKHTFPLSAARAMYEKQEGEMLVVRRCDMEELMRKACELKIAIRQAMNQT